MLSEARAGRAAPLIARLTDSNELDLRGVLEQLTTQLGRLVGFDACGWLICDPDTLLAVDRVSRDEPWTADFAARFCLNEYLEDDVNRFRDLAPARQPVGVLSVATRGAPESSRRYRDLLEPHGLVDELRAAMVVDGNCWGAVNLYRARPAPAFTPKRRAGGA